MGGGRYYKRVYNRNRSFYVCHVIGKGYLPASFPRFRLLSGTTQCGLFMSLVMTTWLCMNGMGGDHPVRSAK